MTELRLEGVVFAYPHGPAVLEGIDLSALQPKKR